MRCYCAGHGVLVMWVRARGEGRRAKKKYARVVGKKEAIGCFENRVRTLLYKNINFYGIFSWKGASNRLFQIRMISVRVADRREKPRGLFV